MMATTYTLSDHAKSRRKQMGVTEDAIQAALSDPEAIYPGDRKYRAGRTCFLRGPIVVVTDDKTQTVVTILWHRKEGR